MRNCLTAIVHLENRTRRVPEDIIGNIDRAIALVPMVVVRGYDNEIHAQFKRDIQNAFTGITKAHHPFTVGICCANQGALGFKRFFRFVSILPKFAVSISPSRIVTSERRLVNVKQS